jgi:hypothetical protein
MFIIIFGTRNVKRLVKDGLMIEKYCSKCLCKRELREFQWRRYFSLFFIPLIPLEKGESILTCTVCYSSYHIQPEDYFEARRQKSTASRHSSHNLETEKIVINCINCKRMIRLPNLGKSIIVTCPHCQSKFEVRQQYRADH